MKFDNNLKNNSLKIGVLALALVVIWGVSQADPVASPEQVIKTTKNYSSLDTVRAIDTNGNTLEVFRTKTNEVSTYNLSSVKQITSRTYEPLSIADIQVGDSLISQGIEKEGAVLIRRLVLMSRGLIEIASSTVATSTPDVASSTEPVATSAPDVTNSTDSATTTTETVVTQPTDPVTPPAEPAPVDPTPAPVEPSPSPETSQN